VTAAHTPRVAVGDVVRVEEPDYRYGAGPLLLRVTAVGGVQREPDGAWLNLRGYQLRSDGRETGLPERYALVRVAAIRVNPPPQKPKR
jgi:hypothetical protein